ncbi:hypothetical protein J3R30DRAFT_3288462 [Lentinula aciculospora]|uniref:DUF829-domain-containing protein n=1 Tax=Lentinula aciculospora TaxID=153920 RepID=A0A9W9ADD6_9AGAR|nr:hypothetical protein J3R30DRAFT_3288462 [Lentinula aciculospora]
MHPSKQNLEQVLKSNVSDPISFSIILIFGWMGAKLPHILKYTQTYEEMYPNATQIIVQSNPQFFWSTDRTRMNNLVPVAEFLESHVCNRTRLEVTPVFQANLPRILVHSFSNGEYFSQRGGLQMYTLGNLLRARSASSYFSTGVSAMIIDSCPGDASLWGALRAFTASLPKKSLLRIPLMIFITLLYSIGIIRYRIFRIQPIFERLKEGLLRKGPEGGVLPWMSEKTRRMYICSKKDELIPVKQVKEHVEEAKRRGLNVMIEVYEDTPHVAHARRYPERYWGAVKDLWTRALENKPVGA